MPLVKDINVNVHPGATTAAATFTQLYEGVWELEELNFVRLSGARQWRPVHNPNVLWTVKTIVTRHLNEQHGRVSGPPRRLTVQPQQYSPRVAFPVGITSSPAGPRVVPVTAPYAAPALVRQSGSPRACLRHDVCECAR